MKLDDKKFIAKGDGKDYDYEISMGGFKAVNKDVAQDIYDTLKASNFDVSISKNTVLIN